MIKIYNNMETLSINIINPKARKLIADLVDLDLIKINDSKLKRKNYLDELTNNLNEEISMEEIVAEVKIVRRERYEQELKLKTNKNQ
jgi:hypothetical protein